MTTEAERLDIVIAARDKELARTLDRVSKRLTRFEQRSNKSLAGAGQSFQRAGRAAATAGASMTGFFNISGAGRFVLQNTAAQLGDVAVQLESGTAASRVAAQQLPQLLGGFGALGGVLGIVAPLLGTVAAVGIPIAATLYAMSDGADDASEKIATFAEKLSAAEAAIGRLEAATALAVGGSISDLEEIYGNVTARVLDLSEALLEIEKRAAKVSIGAVLDEALGEGFRSELDGLFGDVGTALVSAGTAEAEAQAQQIRDLIAQVNSEIDVFENTSQAVPRYLTDQLAEMQAELAAVEGRMAEIGHLAQDLIVGPDTIAAIQDYVSALEDARAAGDFIGVADALSAIRNALIATGEEIDQSVIDGLIQAEDQSRKFAAALGQSASEAENVAAAAAGIAGNIDPAVNAALRLARALGLAVGQAKVLASLGYSVGADGVVRDEKGLVSAGGRGGDPRDFGGSAEDIVAYSSLRGSSVGSAAGGSGGGSRRGGGGGSRRAQREAAEIRKYKSALEDLEDAFASADGQASGYREALEALRAEYDAGDLSAAEFSDGVDTIRDAFRDAARNANNLRNQASRALSEIVTRSKSTKDALSDLFGNLSGQLSNAAFGAVFKSSGLFDFFGGLLSFDGGGFTGSGPRAGGLDGKGGYLAMVHPNESVIDHTKSVRPAAAAGRGQMVININGATGNAEVRDMVAEGVRTGLEYDRRHILPGSVQAILNDPRRRG